MRTWRELARAAGAGVVLLALVAGVPWALCAAVGWPLPREVPNGAELGRALGQPVEALSDGAVIKALAVVVWVAWAQLVACLLVEALAAARARRAGRVPFAGPAQVLAAHLLAPLVVAISLSAGRQSAAPAPLSTILAHATTVTAPSEAHTSEPQVGEVEVRDVAEKPQATRPLPAAPMSYVVRTGDCLWDIAEAHLRDGQGKAAPERWPEIFELNKGVRQSDGRWLRKPDLIRPGWLVRLPADAVAPGGEPPTSQAGAGEGAAAAAPPAPAAAPEQTQTTQASPESPVPLPDTSVTPGSPTPSPPPAAPAPPTTATTAMASEPASEPQSPTPSSVVRSPAGPSRRPSGGVDLGKAAARAAMLAALGVPLTAAGGIVVKLNRLRRAQMARRRPGRDIPRPAPELEPLERRLRAVGAEEAADWLDVALRFLVSTLRQADVAVPELTCVRAGDFGVELLLAPPAPEAPPGFEAADDGNVWRLDGRLDLDELRRRCAEHPVAAPAMVSLGSSPEGPLLGDLEAMGVLCVEGDGARVRAFLAGAVLELTSATWAQGLDLRLLGDLPGLDGVDGVSRVEDPVAFVTQLSAVAASTRRALGPRPSTLAARADTSSGDDWLPTVVVAPEGTAAEELEGLSAAAAGGAGVAVVAAGPLAGARWRLVVAADGAAVLEPLGLRVRASGMEAPLAVDQSHLDEAAIAGSASLLAVASQEDDVAPTDDEEESDTAPPAAPTSEHDYDVWVAVLGPVEVTGWAEPIGRAKRLAELVAYLATHPGHPIPGDAVRAACWPKEEIAYKSFKEALSRVRRHLGSDSEGNRHLPDAVGSAYQLGPGVGCDWIQFQALVAEAERAPDERAVALYRQALALVRGEPFSHVAPGTYSWAWSELLVHRMERVIADAAHRLAELAMAADDADTATWAARQALLATPTQLSLFETEMRAAASRGDVDGIQRGFRGLTQAQARVEPLGEVPPQSAELYRRLMADAGARRSNGGRERPGG
jgi:DNA-binding SARP family transcriptional activator